MDRVLLPCRLSGEIHAIPSKSWAHRALICAALCREETELHLSATSQDIQATQACLESLGAKCTATAHGLRITPIKAIPEAPVLDCRESGSTLRFLIPVAAALAKQSRFLGCGRLPERPILPLLETLSAHGLLYSSAALPLTIGHWKEGGIFYLPGNLSSQFASGILLAAPILADDVEIHFTSPLQSASYLELTCNAMRSFGILVEKTKQGYRVTAGQKYRSPGKFKIEGDWSNAAFWLAAGALSEKGIRLNGLRSDSAQGDRKILSLLLQMGANAHWKGDLLCINGPRPLHSINIDAADIPDLVPILSLLATFAEGETNIQHVSRLRLKESDRLESTAQLIKSLGGEIELQEDQIRIAGAKQLHGGRVQSYKDHRIAMTAAIAASHCTGEILLENSEAVEKSYPHFWQDYIALGGKPHVI